jgi:hypothetical protein
MPLVVRRADNHARQVLPLRRFDVIDSKRVSESMRDAVTRTGISALAAVVLTSIHHAYGAAIYVAPFRRHVVFVFVPIGLIVIGLLYLGWILRGRNLGRLAIGLAVLVIMLLLAGVIGIFEGGYNHLLKNILHFSNVSRELMARLYPAPTYELPNNWFFELTGMLQLLLGLVAGREAYRLAQQVLFRADPPLVMSASEPRHGA